MRIPLLAFLALCLTAATFAAPSALAGDGGESHEIERRLDRIERQIEHLSDVIRAHHPGTRSDCDKGGCHKSKKCDKGGCDEGTCCASKQGKCSGGDCGKGSCSTSGTCDKGDCDKARKGWDDRGCEDGRCEDGGQGRRVAARIMGILEESRSSPSLRLVRGAPRGLRSGPPPMRPGLAEQIAAYEKMIMEADTEAAVAYFLERIEALKAGAR